MADKNIGMLPQVPQLDDESLMVVEQQGTAMKMTGRQFKDFGRQSVLSEVQEYVEEAREAAAGAVEAVKAVADMTVSASTLESGAPATVRKTIQSGVYHLAFGLPRGARGEPGPEGPRGPRGLPGVGLTILGHFDTEEELKSSVIAPKAGDVYSVGTELPYDIYLFDDYDNPVGRWINYGPLTGGGSVLPEDVVTAEGGAALEFGAALGEAPHVITFEDEEEPPLTAEDVQFSETETVKDAIDGLFTSVSNGKQAVASAITDRGVPTDKDAAFSTMAANIRKISGGADTSDATATPGDILSGKTAYTAAGKVEGIIPTLPAQTITPGTANRTIAGGQYLGGTQTIQGDTNLVSANIRKGVSLFGVAGAMTSQFQATLTVKADTGAVVTAKNGDTEVSALSTNGSVVLELPIEGAWTVTAVRGVAQYNSVVVNVSSHYSAELTAEVHIEYFGEITALSMSRGNLAAISTGENAIFAGGGYGSNTFDNVDIYDQQLTKSVLDRLSQKRGALAAVYASGYALFGGGYYDYYSSQNQHYTSNVVDAYDREKVHTTPDRMQARYDLGAAAIGEYGLFGGGRGSFSSDIYAYVEAYDKELVRTEATVLAQPGKASAASNENYAMFGVKAHVSAYNKQLTRTIPVGLKEEYGSLTAVRAGNFVVFIGMPKNSYDTSARPVDAYDLFLTRTNPESLPAHVDAIAATTLREYAVVAALHLNSKDNLTFAYDPYLTRTTPQPMRTVRVGFSGAAVGEYAVFGGGVYTNSTLTKSVEAYKYI